MVSKRKKWEKAGTFFCPLHRVAGFLGQLLHVGLDVIVIHGFPLFCGNLRLVDGDVVLACLQMLLDKGSEVMAEGIELLFCQVFWITLDIEVWYDGMVLIMF
ncbi:MAG: hypothetical protein K6A82_01710 [Prevotella sp.]|nr:hypothetical protein [Prevotella sp.]